MVFVRSMGSLLANTVFVDFLMLSIAVAIGIILQKSVTGWMQGNTSPSPPEARRDPRLSEVEERGFAQVIANRRFRIPMSESIQQPGSFLVYHGIVIV